MSTNVEIIDHLGKLLTTDTSVPFAFNKVTDPDLLKQCVKNKQRYLMELGPDKPLLLFDGHIELHHFFGLLLVDPQTRVLAFVLPEDKSEQSHWFEQQLGKINMVQYALRQKAKNKYGHYTVEVLFSVQDNKVIEKQLTHLACNTQLLHLISVNYIQSNQGQVVTAQELKQAMPWLLLSYKQWACKVKKTARINQITMQDYRLPIIRSIAFHEKANIHLVHGHNGSGKSSLAEIIELFNTGQLKRLEPRETDQYHRVVVSNHNGAKKAMINIELSKDGLPEDCDVFNKFEISAANDKAPGLVDIASEGFILNQQLIDDLSRNGGKQRYEIFFNAFFSQDRTDFHEGKRLREEIEQWRKILTNQLNCEQDKQSLLLAITAALTDFPPADAILPVTMEQLKALVKIDESISPVIVDLAKAEDFETFKQTLQNLDKPLTDLCGRMSLLNDFKQARDVLVRYQSGCLPESNNDGESYSHQFEEWCIAQAKIDLLTKRLQLDKISESKVLNQQQKDGLGLAINNGEGLTPSTHFVLGSNKKSELTTELENQQNLSDDLRQNLEEGEQQSDKNSQPTDGHQQAIRPVTNQELALFNSIGEFLTDEEQTRLLSLGNSLAKAVNHQQSSTLAMALGMKNSGWGAPLVSQLNGLIDAMEALKEVHQDWLTIKWPDNTKPVQFGADVWLVLCQRASIQLEALSAIEARSEQNILAQLSKENNVLFDALNELLCLFTPARWLYQPLKIKADSDNKKFALYLNDPDIDASLLWNSAELNLVAVTLFLLCANRTTTKRRVNTLVMDDPLQNMDELTSTYLARGLAKLQYCWPDLGINQQLIMLFHGEQAVARFSQEIPAAVYYLPWRDVPDTAGAKTAGESPESDNTITHDSKCSLIETTEDISLSGVFTIKVVESTEDSSKERDKE
jgi:energy-coupling factor transporter ATP-binding protein EcfA2